MPDISENAKENVEVANMPASQRPQLRFQRIFFIIAFCAFSALAIMSYIQIIKSRTLYPEYAVPKQDNLDASVTELTVQRPGQVYSAITFGAPHNGFSHNVGSSASFKLPKRWYGYVLHLGIEKYDNEMPTTIECLINGRKIFEHSIISRRFSRKKPYGGFRIPIPAKQLNDAEKNIVIIRNASGGYWEGRLYLIPGYLLRTLLPYILPILGFLVILSTTFLSSSYRSRWLPLLIAFVMFFVYRYTYFVHDHTGFGGFFFDDIQDIINDVSGDKYSHDMMKHPIFLPVMRVFYGIWRGAGLDRLDAMSAGFALVAGINVALAFIWFKRVWKDKLYALPLVTAYSLLFAVWAYSSLYETYILSALSVNLTMILFWAKPVTKSIRNVIYSAIMISISALINPPMLLLISVAIVMLIMSEMPARRKCFHAGVLLAAVIVIFVIGYYLVLLFYMSHTATAKGLHLPFSQEFAKKGVFTRYAGISNMTLNNMLKVLAGQFIYSFFGQSYPFDYGLDSPVRYVTNILGIISIIVLLTLWIFLVIAMCKNRRFMTATFLLEAIVILPYIVFFWYFNPSEMLLYSSPLLSLIILWFSKASDLIFNGKSRWLFWGIAAVFLVVNMIAITSYR